MSLLDRFRGQPEWQHEDPSVRASAVDDLEDDAQDLLTAIASEDADPGVRAAAVGRLTDPETLGRIQQSDQDDSVKEEAAAVLREMALASEDPERAESAVAALSAPRDLGEVARTAGLEAVSLAALARLERPKTVGAVARRAAHAATRQAALERLDDRDELLAVAVKSEHRDVAVAAFERLVPEGSDDLTLLQTISVRARAKPVARKARARLAELAGRPKAPTASQRQERRELISGRLEALAAPDGASDEARLGGELEELEREWAALDAAASASGEDDAPAAVERWQAAVAAAKVRLRELAAARAELEARRLAAAEADKVRAALCDRLEARLGQTGEVAESLEDTVAAIRSEWEATGDDESVSDTSEPRPTDQRFQALLARADGQIQGRRSAAERRARLEELAAALEELSQVEDVARLNRQWTRPHAEWTELLDASDPEAVAELVARVEAAVTRRDERVKTARAQQSKREKATLAKQLKRAEEIDQALANEQLELREAERWLRITRSVLGNMGRLPTREDRDTLTRRFQAAQTALTGRVRELRGFAEWKQWANLGVQAALCQRMEKLAELEDDAAMAREYREVMTAWRDAADVPRGEGDEIWKRFKTAHESIQPRVEAFQTAEDALRQQRSAQKAALCEEAERLADSTDWVKTAKRFTELQAEWKQVGAATRKQERELWNRFRAASGQFFKRRRDDLADRRKVWGKNAEAKEALCVQAEALADESDLEAAKNTAKRLQAEWKNVGPVKRSRSDALWARFRAACDAVFGRAQAEVDAQFADKIKARAEVCERLEQLVPETGGESGSGSEDAPEPPGDLAETVAAIRAEWHQLPPVPRVQERSLSSRFHDALARVVERHPAAFEGTDLDPARNRAKLEALCERVEGLMKEAPPPSASDQSPAEILAAQLREALASNTMGARVDPAAKQRADTETVRQAQSERRALGVIPGDEGRQLSDRFRTACERFFAKYPPLDDARPSSRRDGPARRRRPRPKTAAGSRHRA